MSPGVHNVSSRILSDLAERQVRPILEENGGVGPRTRGRRFAHGKHLLYRVERWLCCIANDADTASKFGVSAQPLRRLRDLRGGIDKRGDLRIVRLWALGECDGDRALWFETFIHRWIRADLGGARGSEWYPVSPDELTAAVERVMARWGWDFAVVEPSALRRTA